ncbi:MAG: DUF2851 family protein [Bacteroidetes bacterium]|nr:DUF2851 family protein [Bacteroidota bacterium]
MFVDTPFLIHEPRRPAVPESDVERMWLLRARPEVSFITVQGQTVRVIGAGTRNRHDGPDFLRASVVVDGTLRRGDIELHVRPEDWLRHGHNRDPRYARVVLHVCLYDGAFPRDIPGIALAAQLGQPFRAAWDDARRQRQLLPCRGAGTEVAGMAIPSAFPMVETMTVLLAATRFMRKTARLRRRLETLRREGSRHDTSGHGFDAAAAFRQLVYESFARAAGYGGNEEAFERLARALPLCALAALPSDQRFACALDRASALDWNSSGVMPHNRMRGRLRWFADWAPRLDRRDWWRGVLATAHRGETDAAMWQAMFRAGEDGNRREAGEQPGPGRVAEFVINVLAPALHVYASTRGDTVLAQRAAVLFFSVTPAPANRYTRLIESGFGLPRHDAGAQQGMIELASEFCLPRHCVHCLQGAMSSACHATPERAACTNGAYLPESLPV